LHLVDESDAIPLGSVDELVGYFHAAGKPRSAWRIGTEHELIGVRSTGRHGPVGTAPAYDGPDGIGAVLAGFAALGWQPVLEGGQVIALTCHDGQITIEPGGQLELAAPPLDNDRAFRALLADHVQTLGGISADLGLAWLATGLRPFGRRDDVPWMPKARYAVMRAYMPQVGSRGLDMMLRTATVQVNLDYADADDAGAKLRCALSVTSILTALWASSPIIDGEDSGYQSVRAHIWRDTDRARTGLLPLAFADGDVYRAYVEWALDVPMYFVHRGGYRPVRGMTFRRYLRDGWQGERATRADWALHLSTLFPEARLKTYLEVRGCDCGSLEMIAALAPLCRGLLYDADACAAATALTAGASLADRERLADEVPRAGLRAMIGGRRVLDLARELVAIARAGLARVAPDEIQLLEPVERIAATGRTQADDIAEIWRTTRGDPAHAIRRLAHPGLAG
jgi:glutamate--cysteine ligase